MASYRGEEVSEPRTRQRGLFLGLRLLMGGLCFGSQVKQRFTWQQGNVASGPGGVRRVPFSARRVPVPGGSMLCDCGPAPETSHCSNFNL